MSVSGNQDFEAMRRQVQESRESFGMSASDGTIPKKKPNIPSCDACGDEFSGNMQCSACACAFYCSTECQKHAWKSHKKQCKTMKQEGIDNGKKVVEDLRNTDLPPIVRVQGLNSLDSEGYYKMAVEQGLHQALMEVLREDLECAMGRFAKKNRMENVVFLHWIVNTIFRGQRISRAGTPTFGKLDGGRIKAFLESEVEAFPTWWKAAVLISRIPLSRTTSPDVQLLIHHQARDVWAAFAMFFCNNRASRAALLLGDPQKCKERAEWMLKELKPAFVDRWNSPDELDQGSAVEAHMNTDCAILAERVRRDAGVELNVEKYTGMKGVHRKMYREMGVPMGKATLKKGRALTTPESMAVFQQM